MIAQDSNFEGYKKLFVQPWPCFAVKTTGKGRTWHWLQKSIPNNIIKQHLDKKIWVATLGRWYPEVSIIDIDRKSEYEVENIRSALGFNEDNSMLCHSETVGNYHLLFKPEYRNSPPTIKLLNDILTPEVSRMGCEVYPQKNRTIRLPWGYKQYGADPGRELLSWEQQLYWFGKLDPFDLSSISTRFESNNERSYRPANRGFVASGKEYLETGLIKPSSRHGAQFAVLYNYFQMNYQQEIAEEWTLKWLKRAHHGYSKEINIGNWKIVISEIHRQAQHIWEKYKFFPSTTYNRFYGTITKKDLVEILWLSDGVFSRMSFLYNLIRYCQPRRTQVGGVAIHSDTLISWSNKNSYQTRLQELQKKQVIERGSKYVKGLESKRITINWDYSSEELPILLDGETPENVVEAIAASFQPAEISSILSLKKVPSSNISKIITKIYEENASKRRNI